MIARHEVPDHVTTDVWSKLAAALPAGAVSWRQDGKPGQRDGKYFARFVAYIDAHTVRERLDSVAPGEWDVALEALPLLAAGGEVVAEPYAMKAKLTVLGVARECVGQGPDWKQAATDAFKRSAVRFGIGHELYAMEPNWVQVDGDGRFAKALEDPQAAYDRRYGTGSAAGNGHGNGHGNGKPVTHAAPRAAAPAAETATATAPARVADTVAATAAEVVGDNPNCPKCAGKMWDNRVGKRNPKAPDFKCRDKSCDGVIWPPKGGTGAKAAAPPADEPPAYDGDPGDDDESLPF